jgi:hypothetical protein
VKRKLKKTLKALRTLWGLKSWKAAKSDTPNYLGGDKKHPRHTPDIK